MCCACERLKSELDDAIQNNYQRRKMCDFGFFNLFTRISLRNKIIRIRRRKTEREY